MQASSTSFSARRCRARAVPPWSPPRRRKGIYIPLLTYRTGPFGGSGTPVANGMSDYFKMLNERDGGIGGVK